MPGRSRPGVLALGHPCGDDAALLVSELFANSIRHGGSVAEGETVTIAVRVAGGVVRVEVTDRSAAGGCRIFGPAVVRRKVAGGWSWWRGWPRGGGGGGAAGGW